MALATIRLMAAVEHTETKGWRKLRGIEKYNDVCGLRHDGDKASSGAPIHPLSGY
jgi:hypothetical protein